MSEEKSEEKNLSIDELIEPLIIETSDYKKMRLDKTIYTQFKLFNDFVEIRNSNRKEKRKENKKEDEILKLNIPSKIINKIINMMWETTMSSVFYTSNKDRYKKVFDYLGFEPEKVKILDKILKAIYNDNSIIEFIKEYRNSDEINMYKNFTIEYKSFVSSDELKTFFDNKWNRIRIITECIKKSNKYNVDLYVTDIYPSNFKWQVSIIDHY